MAEKMDPKIKKMWVKALRSGEYKQAKRELRTHDDRFCCLGVLCNLHAQMHPKLAATQTVKTRYLGESSYPNFVVYKWAKLVICTTVTINGKIDFLAGHNDNGRTFLEIADAIEKQL